MDDKPFHLMTEIENYLLANAMTPTRFGIAAVNDPKFVFELGAGCQVRPEAIMEALAFMGIDVFAQPAASAAEPRRFGRRQAVTMQPMRLAA
jgi:hypothetical protein